jgi:hypothetical protein
VAQQAEPGLARSRYKGWAHQGRGRIRRVTSPDFRLDNSVARLCILREDFAIEMQGVYQEEIDALDRHSAAWRRTYFIRNLVRTLIEVMSTMNSLKAAPEFIALLERQSEQVRAKFDELFRAMVDAHPIVKRIRNTICAHLKHTAMQDALVGMSHDRWGFLEVGHVLKDVHYKFAAEIAIEILVSGVPEDLREEILRSDLVKIAGLFPVFELTYHVLSMYIIDRRLV